MLRAKGGEKNVRDATLLEFEAQVIEKLPGRKLDPAWSEQDHAAGLLFRAAYRASLDPKPQLLADARRIADALSTVAKQLRRLEKELQSIDIGVTAIYAAELAEVAADCESDATLYAPNSMHHPGSVNPKAWRSSTQGIRGQALRTNRIFVWQAAVLDHCERYERGVLQNVRR